MAKRIDAVFIRKSTQAQDQRAQIENVKNMLRERGVTVSERQWFVGVVSRRKVKSNAEFNRLMAMIESGSIDTVYVESQDRWGTSDRVELFHVLGILRENDTRLFDLRAKKDVTENDFATEMLAIIKSFQSEQDLKDTSYRSLRTRVNNFKDSGSWPTGPQPFGYGKACYAPDGRLLWVWQPSSRTLGQVFYAGDGGKLKPGPDGIPIPRKAKLDRNVLVPHSNKQYVKAVRTAFDLYTRLGLSRRKISEQLNAGGYTYYGKPFTHSLVTLVLDNPAYVGDTHFGKTLTGELHSFDGSGMLNELKNRVGVEKRAVADRIVKTDTHEALIDRETWRQAEEKRTGEQKRVSHPPRNPNYYLKQIFVCGHCGKGMTPRKEKISSGEKIVYVCSSYQNGKCNGHPSDCGYQRISHDDAEQMLLDKIAELNLAFDPSDGEASKAIAEERLRKLESASERMDDEWAMLTREAIRDLMDYLNESFDIDYRTHRKLTRLATRACCEERLDEGDFASLPLKLKEFRQAIVDAEEAATAKARARVEALTAELRTFTASWMKLSARQQALMQPERDRIETELADWERRAEPVWTRLEGLYAEEAARHAERKKLLAELPSLQNREKGEAFRRLFKTVTLYWDREFRPASDSKERKTDRKGRYSYTLRRDRTEWSFADLDSSCSW